VSDRRSHVPIGNGQRAVIRFFSLKGLKAKGIQDELESVYGTDACKLLMVKKWRLRFLQGRTTLFDDPRFGRLLTQDRDEAVRLMIGEKSFTSCRVLCRHFRIAKTTYLRILHDELRLQKFHLRWVLHALFLNQQSKCVTYSSLLLEVLEEAQRIGFERVITRDESWFFLSSPHDSAEATSRDEFSERVSPKTDTEKCLISIFWSVNDIHTLIDFPKGSTDNTTFFCDQVVPSLVDGITSHGNRSTLQRFMIHFDNASLHNSRQSQECLEAQRVRRLQHPADRPDFAPSNCFLFGYLKEKQADFDYRSREDQKSAITSIFNEIDKETLVAVFVSWMEGIKWVIRKKGRHYHK
jgi:hypothetical protein